MEAGALRAPRSGPERAQALLIAGTSIRIVAVPIVMALVISGSDTAAVIVFLAAAATDWFDGRLARRWNVTTRIGSFLDTTADKLLVTGAMVALLAVDRMSPWFAIIIIGREFTILGLRAAVEAHGSHLEPSMLGKWKATIQFAALGLVMIRPDVTIAGAYLDEWGIALAALITVWSGVQYLINFSSALRADT
jgi:CDP-diacylglycerol--glycerol-3-phosphate 3-phosphatidyltransferase